MRTFLFFAGSTLGSIGFQASVAIWPDELQKLAWLVPWIWGLWAVIWLIWLATHPALVGAVFGKKKSTPVQPPEAPYQRTGDVRVGDFRGGDVKTGDIHINLPPTIPPASPFPRYEKPEEKIANVKFLRAKDVNLRFDPYEGLSFHETDGPRNLIGLVACFRNDAIYGQVVSPAKYLRAHLRFMDASGQEIGTGISGACWLAYKGDLMTLKADESACVLIVTKSKEEFFIPWKQRKLVSLGSESIFDRDEKFTEPPNAVEVRLVDANSKLALEPVLLDISLENNVFRAVPRQR